MAKELTAVKKEFIQAMVNYSALKFGSFELKSGRISPFFFNIGDLSRGECLHVLAEAYGEAIHEKFGENFDVLFGPAYKGIPLAAITAKYLYDTYGMDVRYCSNRKEAKDHGEAGKLLGGPIRDGDIVVLIEDVMTSGKSIKEVVPMIKEKADVTIIGEIISLDRQERGEGTEEFALKAISDEYGFPVESIITIQDVIDILYTNGDKTILTEEIYQSIQAYRAEYGGKTVA